MNRAEKTMTINNTQITSHQRHLLHQTAYEMGKRGFLTKETSIGTLRFERPNSEAAMTLTIEANRVVIRKDFTGPLMLGELFIRALIGSGLYVFDMINDELAMVGTTAG